MSLKVQFLIFCSFRNITVIIVSDNYVQNIGLLPQYFFKLHNLLIFMAYKLVEVSVDEC